MTQSIFDSEIVILDNTSDNDMRRYVDHMAKGQYLECEWASPMIRYARATFYTELDQIEQGLQTSLIFKHGTTECEIYLYNRFPLDHIGYKAAMRWFRDKSHHVLTRGVCTKCVTNTLRPECRVRLQDRTDCIQCYIAKLIFNTDKNVPEVRQALPAQLTFKLLDRIGNLATDLVGEYTEPYNLSVLEGILTHVRYISTFSVEGASPKFPIIMINIGSLPDAEIFHLTIHFYLSSTGTHISMRYSNQYRGTTWGIKRALDFMHKTMIAAELRVICSKCLDEPDKNMCDIGSTVCYKHQ
jgi:hypothetical protein